MNPINEQINSTAILNEFPLDFGCYSNAFNKNPKILRMPIVTQ